MFYINKELGNNNPIIEIRGAVGLPIGNNRLTKLHFCDTI